jgi:hypothetical protein
MTTSAENQDKEYVFYHLKNLEKDKQIFTRYFASAEK